MVTHLHQHVQRVEAVNLVAQSDEAVELCLDALEDFIHHQPHYIFPVNEKKKRTIALKKKKNYIRNISNDLRELTLMTRSVCVLPGEAF